MHIALTVLVLLVGKAALSEAPPEQTTSTLNTSIQFIERLNTLSIDPPTLDPLEDPWIRIDKEMEFTLETFPSPPPQGWSLDAICQKKDVRAEAFRIPSSPNIIFSLLEIHQSSETEDENRDPWITNVISTEKGEKARSVTKQCHQLVLPVPVGQKGYTRIGQCASAPVMCTRKRQWNLTPLARVKYQLVKNAAKHTNTSMRKWTRPPITQGPDLTSIMEGIDKKVWEEEEKLSLMTLALQLLTDWTTTIAINQLSGQLTNLEDLIEPLITKSKQPNTIPPDSDDPISTEENPLLEIKDWESRITQLETKWAQFLQINNQTHHRMEDLLAASGFMNEQGSGLAQEYDESTSQLTGLEAFASLCNSLTRSINITLKPRSKRSQANESDSLDSEEYPPFLKTIAAKVTQVYNQATSSFYTPMNECVPCYTIVTTIFGLVILTFIHTVVLCILCVRPKTTKKHVRKAIEKETPKKETPERGLTTAAAKRENSRASARHRERVTYTLHPTKGK